MALRILLSSGREGNAVVRQRCKTGISGLLKSCFSTPIIINTIHHRRGLHFSRADWLAGRTKGISFSHYPKDSYIFQTITSATVMDPQNNIEIVSIAQFAVNEHNSEREDDEAEEAMAEKGAKVDEEDCAGGLTKRYKAIVSQSTTNGVLTLNWLGPNSTPFQDEFINEEGAKVLRTTAMRSHLYSALGISEREGVCTLKLGEHRYGKEAVKMH